MLDVLGKKCIFIFKGSELQYMIKYIISCFIGVGKYKSLYCLTSLNHFISSFTKKGNEDVNNE